MRKRMLLISMLAVTLALMNTLFADTNGGVPIKRPADSVTAKITSINGNIITITNDRGNTKTLEMVSTRGLAVGTQTGWCEEDCGRLKIGDRTIRVQRVIEGRR